jgi:hypothetical protein
MECEECQQPQNQLLLHLRADHLLWQLTDTLFLLVIAHQCGRKVYCHAARKSALDLNAFTRPDCANLRYRSQKGLIVFKARSERFTKDLRGHLILRSRLVSREMIMISSMSHCYSALSQATAGTWPASVVRWIDRSATLIKDYEQIQPCGNDPATVDCRAACWGLGRS